MDEIKNCSFSVAEALKARCGGGTKVVNEERTLLDAMSNKDGINNGLALKIKELMHQLKVKDDLIKNYKNNYEEVLNDEKRKVKFLEEQLKDKDTIITNYEKILYEEREEKKDLERKVINNNDIKNKCYCSYEQVLHKENLKEEMIYKEKIIKEVMIHNEDLMFKEIEVIKVMIELADDNKKEQQNLIQTHYDEKLNLKDSHVLEVEMLNTKFGDVITKMEKNNKKEVQECHVFYKNLIEGLTEKFNTAMLRNKSKAIIDKGKCIKQTLDIFEEKLKEQNEEFSLRNRIP